MRRITKLIFTCMIFAIAMVSVSQVQALSYTQVPGNIGNQTIQNSISYIGGGNAPFSENGVMYYQSGNVIELTVTLPANTYAIGMQEIITYDIDELELVTSFSEIRGTFGRSLINEGWSQDVSKLNGKNNQILVYAVANDYTTSVTVSSGTIAKMRFRVKEKAQTSSGVRMDFNFNYQIGGVTSAGEKVYIHAGYDAANDAATSFVSAPSISLPAHRLPTVKPSIPVENNPEMEYRPDIVIDKEIDAVKKQEIQDIVSKREYSFKQSKDGISGVNTHRNIAQLFIDSKVKSTDKAKYQTTHFNNIGANSLAKTVEVRTTCYTHYIYIGLSFVVIFITYGYKKYTDAQRQVQWRGQ